ncbi:MAG: ACT domain-containing protein [Lachnospiraceae bacterium]|nr:ACT domain-containing protein [Lachnospiraceae bacterium]
MDIVKIAVLGPKGTFSDMAYMEYRQLVLERFRDKGDKLCIEAEYYPTIDEVFNAVCDDAGNGVCDMGIVPIENTLDGYVQRTLDLLLEKQVGILDEHTVPVQFALVANGASTEEISTLYVQFKANGQCRKFINSLNNVNIVSTESNMESYYKLKDIQGNAAIVPSHVASWEKNSDSNRLVQEGITDAENNYTRFVVFKKEDKVSFNGYVTKNKVRIPVYIMPKSDRPGLLFEILKEFYDKDINLISIMSRPTKQELGTYNFYIEIDGYASTISTIKEALANIKVYNDIKVLGIYEEDGI